MVVGVCQSEVHIIMLLQLLLLVLALQLHTGYRSDGGSVCI